MRSSSITLACVGTSGERLGSLAIADSAGQPSMELVDQQLTVSELSDYIVMLNDPAWFVDSFSPPLESSVLQSRRQLVATLKRLDGLGSVRVALCASDKRILWSRLIRIRPQKLKAQSEYERIVSDICAWRLALALDLKARTSASWKFDRGVRPQSPEEDLVLLRSVFDEHDIFNAIENIRRDALARLKRQDEMIALGRGGADPVRISRDLRQPGARVAVPSAHPLKDRLDSLPARVTSSRSFDSVDTPENQFVKHTLGQLQSKLDHSRTKVGSWPSSELSVWADRTSAALRRTRASAFFSRISNPAFLAAGSPALQRRRGYRTILQAAVALHAGFSLSWPELSAAIYGETRDMPTLYEYWCLVKLIDTLCAEFGAEFSRTDFVSSDGNCRLKRGTHAPSTRSIEIQGKSLRLHLYYNRTFAPTQTGTLGIVDVHDAEADSWSKTMRPDYTVAFWPATYSTYSEAFADGKSRLVHFDAKYKFSPASLKNGDTTDGRKSAPDDLDKMHSYLGGIPSSSGAFVLFPGDQSKVILKGEGGPTVGALALSPISATSFGHNLRTALEVALR